MVNPTIYDIVVNGQGTVGHSGTLIEWLIMVGIILIMVVIMHQWMTNWRAPVKERGERLMLKLHGLHELKRVR